MEVPPTRRFRGIPGIGAVLVATWWIPMLWAIGLESRSNNTGWLDVLALDIVAIVALAAGALLQRARSSVELTDTELRWRGPVGTYVPGVVPETDVVPVSWETGLVRVAFILVGVAIWVMAFTAGGSIGAIVVALAWLAWRASSAANVEQRAWPWRSVRLVALEGGSPAVLVRDEGVLDLSPMVSETSRNERMVWTIAALARRAGATDDVETDDDVVRSLTREAARAPRPTPTGPTTIQPSGAHAIRGRLAPLPSLVVGGVLIALFGWRAAQGDVRSIVIFTCVVVTLAIVFAVQFFRASRLRLEVTTSELVVHQVLRGSRRIPLGSIGAVVGIPVMQHPSPGDHRIDVDGLVVDRDGELLVRLRGGDWSGEQLDALAAAVGVTGTAVNDVLPITTLAHAFPGYASAWEREPGKVGVLIAIALVVVVTAVVFAMDWQGMLGGDEDCCSPDVPSEFELQQRDRRAVERDVEPLLLATFPSSERDGGLPTGCVEFDGPGATTTGCEHVDPVLDRAIVRIAGADALSAMSVLCRCEPDEYASGYIEGVANPDADPDGGDRYDVARSDPRVLAGYTQVDARGVVLLEVELVRDPATGERRISDVHCASGPPGSLSRAPAGATVASLRCPVEDTSG